MNNYATAKNLENIILHVVAKNVSNLDLSNESLISNTSTDILIKKIRNSDNLILIGTKNPYELLLTIDDDKKVKIITNGYETLDKLKISNKTNIEFILSQPYDLSTNLGLINEFFKKHSTINITDYNSLQSAISEQKINNPIIRDNSVDTVVIDKLINSLEWVNIKESISEAFRVLTKGGSIQIRIILSDEKCNELLPITINDQVLKHVPFEQDIINFMNEVGFYGMEYVYRSELPIKVINGIEFHEFIISGNKGKQGPCLDCGQAVIYRGPWKEVIDDDGHHYKRGERVAVCSKTYGITNNQPYAEQFIYVPSYIDIPEDRAHLFDCNTPKNRDIHVTKGITDINSTYGNSNELTACDCGCNC